MKGWGGAAAEAVRRPIQLLRTAPRELWLVYLLKVLDSYGYFALSEVFTMLLTDEFGIDDVTAGRHTIQRYFFANGPKHQF
jgi:POT family proton-dependent oligopeptide transporter